MKVIRKVGVTSEIWQIFIADSSSSTGAGLTGLVFNSSSLTAYYHRDTDTTATAISLVTMTVGTFTSSGFKEIDATNMPGWYQFCPPNAAIASGAKTCAFLLKGATNMAPLPIEVDLSAQVDVSSINAVSTSSVTTINANVGTTQPTNFSGTGASAFVKSDMEQINTQTASAAGTVTFPASTLASTTNITAGTITTTTNLTNAATAGDFTATMKTSIGTAVAASAVASVTGAVGSVTGSVGGNVTGSVGSISGITFPTHFSALAITAGGAAAVDGTSALTEAYSTQGSGFTLAQCLYDMHQFFYAHSTSSTTWTVKKRDNSTTAKTATLDSSTVPTQLIEAS